VIGNGRVAVKARIPVAAAFELDRNTIERRMPMSAAGLLIDVDPINFAAVNNLHE
jgi:hypothetical protein